MSPTYFKIYGYAGSSCNFICGILNEVQDSMTMLPISKFGDVHAVFPQPYAHYCHDFGSMAVTHDIERNVLISVDSVKDRAIAEILAIVKCVFPIIWKSPYWIKNFNRLVNSVIDDHRLVRIIVENPNTDDTVNIVMYLLLSDSIAYIKSNGIFPDEQIIPPVPSLILPFQTILHGDSQEFATNISKFFVDGLLEEQKNFIIQNHSVYKSMQNAEILTDPFLYMDTVTDRALRSISKLRN
jgi:hypothetical protein